jgi:hypothetical protein
MGKVGFPLFIVRTRSLYWFTGYCISPHLENYFDQKIRHGTAVCAYA